MAAICGFQNAFSTAVDLPRVLTPGPKFSHTTEAMTNNRQGFSILVLAGEAVCSAISLLVAVPVVWVVALPASWSLLGEDNTWLKMVLGVFHQSLNLI